MNHFKFGALGAVVIAATVGCAQTSTQKPAAGAPAAPAVASGTSTAPTASAAPAAATTGQAPRGKAALVAQFLEIERPSIEALARELVTGSSDPIARAASGYLQTQVPADKRPELAKAADAEFKRYFDDTYPTVRDKALQLAPSTLGPILESNFSEDQLRELLRSSFRALRRLDDAFEVEVDLGGETSRFEHPDVAEAYGLALLELIGRSR